MKDNILIVAVALVAVAALGLFGWTTVQAGSESLYGYEDMMQGDWGSMTGEGMMGTGMMSGGYGAMGMGAGMMSSQPEMQALHAFMYTAMADALNIAVEEFETRHAAGETFWDIAAAQGYSQEEAWELMHEAKEQALEAALEQGVITEEFVEWMEAHEELMHGEDGDAFGGHCGEGSSFQQQGQDL